jgi:hypothetical protein
MTVEQSAQPPALRMPRPDLVRYTLAPVVTDAGQAAQMQAGEERFYDVLLDIWTGIIAREMAAEAATNSTPPTEQGPRVHVAG